MYIFHRRCWALAVLTFVMKRFTKYIGNYEINGNGALQAKITSVCVCGYRVDIRQISYLPNKFAVFLLWRFSLCSKRPYRLGCYAIVIKHYSHVVRVLCEHHTFMAQIGSVHFANECLTVCASTTVKPGRRVLFNTNFLSK